MIRLSRALSKKPKSGFQRGVVPSMKNIREPDQPKRINLEVLPRKARQLVEQEENNAKRGIIDWQTSPYNPFEAPMTRGSRYHDIEKRKRILDYRYSSEHFDEYRARREKPIIDKIVDAIQEPYKMHTKPLETNFRVKKERKDVREIWRKEQLHIEATQRLADVVDQDAQPDNNAFFEENWKQIVEPNLPQIQIPEPNLNQPFPTPSGWQPPYPEKTAKLAYSVRRTRFHEFGISEEERASEMYDLNFDNRYEDEWDKMLRKRDPAKDIPLTHLEGCEGDIFALRGELVDKLSALTGEPIAASADEPGGKITFSGRLYDPLEQCLFAIGF